MVTYRGGSGDSLETAIVITDASDHGAAVAAEYAYIERELGRRREDWKLDQQTLLQPDAGRSYDLIEVQLADGGKREFYFDITEAMESLSSEVGERSP